MSEPLFKIAGPKYCTNCGTDGLAIIVASTRKGKEVRCMRCKNCGAEFDIDWKNPKAPRPLSMGLYANICLRGLNSYV